MNSKQRIRARLILLAILIASLGLISSLYWTQIIKGSAYVARADKQYVKPSASLFDRGSIFFQSKDGTRASAATIGSGFLVYMNPSLVINPTQTYDALSRYIPLIKSDFIARASKSHDLYEELAQKLPEEKANLVRDLGLPGIGVVKQTWRSYPGASLAAHTLGLIGEGSDGVVTGKYGLERTYEKTLARNGTASGNTVFAGLFSSLRDSVFGSLDTTQGDVVTAIDPTVQGYLETVLGEIQKSWHPDEIGGVIMDPKTGEIRALASVPDFDPNNLSKVKNPSILSNPLVEHVYEMGSILKPLTMATALDVGAITIDSTYTDTGTMTLNGKKISNYDGKARGPGTPMQKILSESLNIGAATIALKVGKDTFSKYFQSFGVGMKSGIDAPNEALGIIGNLKSGRDIEIATAAYGQGIAMSPIVMTQALAVLANGGYLVQPHIATTIDHVNGSTQTISVSKTGPLLKKQTIEDVTRMLVKVVDDKMSVAHPNIKMEHYSVAAKTGTAQIADHVHGGYYPDKYLHSFFGYFPAYDPKYIVFLYQIYPKGANFASETLTDPFSELEKFLINYYNIPPDR